MLKGYTHICIHPIDPDDDTGTPRFCHEPIALSRPHGTWIQKGAQRHVEREHGDAPASIESAERAEKREEQKVRQQLLVENPLAPSQQTTLRAEFTLTKEQAELSSQAAWYVYATMHVSKQAFDDKYWKGMMNTAGAKCLINRQQLRKWVRAEFSVFKLFLRYMIERKCMQAQGNAYAQFLHDGGTLASHRKYQALGMQFLSPDWDRNFVICFGFPRSKHNKDVEVAELAVIQFMSQAKSDGDLGPSERHMEKLQSRLMTTSSPAFHMTTGSRLTQFWSRSKTVSEDGRVVAYYVLLMIDMYSCRGLPVLYEHDLMRQAERAISMLDAKGVRAQGPKFKDLGGGSMYGGIPLLAGLIGQHHHLD